MPETKGYGCLAFPGIALGIIAGFAFKEPTLGLLGGVVGSLVVILGLGLRDTIRRR